MCTKLQDLLHVFFHSKVYWRQVLTGLHRRALCLSLIVLHLAYVYPSEGLADSLSPRSSAAGITDLKLTHDAPLSWLQSKTDWNAPRPVVEERPYIPDDIPAARQSLLVVDVPGPQSPDLTLPEDALQRIRQLYPAEQLAALSLIDDTAQMSWQEYLSWFSGEAPNRLRIELIQTNGRDMNLDQTSSVLIIEGFGPGESSLGQVRFKMGPELVSEGDDATSRDYENFEATLERARAFEHRWGQLLLPPFDPLDWARLEYDQHGNLVRVTPGPRARQLQDEVTADITRIIGELEGVGPSHSSLGLLQAFKNIAEGDDLACLATSLGVMALFALGAKLVAWVATQIVIAIIGAVFIYPLLQLFHKLSKAIHAVREAVDAIELALQSHLTLLDIQGKHKKIRKIKAARAGLMADIDRMLMQYESRVHQSLLKKKLRYMRKIFFVQDAGRIIGWAASVLAGAASAYWTWKECKERKWFPERARTLTGVEYFLIDSQRTYVRLTNWVTADDADHVTAIRFNTVQEMEPFLDRDYIYSLVSLNTFIRVKLDMGTYPDNYTNTIESRRDLVAVAGRYVFWFYDYEGHGYIEPPQRITALLNMPILTAKSRSDLHPGEWIGWAPFDIYYPFRGEACDVKWRTGRDRGWCEIALALERDWNTSPEDPGPNVILRLEFPTVRM